MSTLQVANIFFDSLGNNKIVYESNSVVFSTSGSEALSDTKISEIVSRRAFPPTGAFEFSFNSTTPNGFIAITNTTLNRADYPTLGDLLSVTPYVDVPAGFAWTSRTSANTNRQNALAFGNGVYVSVGNVGTIQSSTDAITWTNRTTANTNDQLSVAYGNGVFVSVGAAGSIQSSTNGTTWTNRTTANTNIQNGVTYGNGVFVAVGVAGSIQTSTDGTTWTNRTGANTNQLKAVTYGNGIFVAVGNSGVIQTSTNGTTWVNRTGAITTANNTGVAHGNGYFVTVATFASPQYSTDAVTWSAGSTAVSTGYNTIAYGNGIFIAAVGSSELVLSSNNGQRFDYQEVAGSVSVFGTLYAENQFVINGSGIIQTSNSYVSYNTATEFKTPKFNGSHSPLDNGYGQTIYAFIKT